MAIIYSYPKELNILPADILIGTTTKLVAGKPKNQTKSYAMQDIANFVVNTIPRGTLTTSNDANVTLTLGGVPLNSLFSNVSIAVGWSGLLADDRIASSGYWNDAYNSKINSAAVTGGSSKLLTLTQQDGGTITASWEDGGDSIELTTVGTSGPATLIGSILNIPNYSTSVSALNSTFVNTSISGTLNSPVITSSLSATGTPDSTTFLRGDNTWATVAARDVQNTVKAGAAINKGQAVYVTGADGTNIIVGLASNISEATSSKTLGLLNASVAVNGFADVIQVGKLSGLNTIGANVGDPVWLGTNGNLIYGLANKPYAPAHLVYIGVVTRVNANNGEIFVTVQNGFELKEIHDVDIVTTVPVNGDILGYDGILWVNKTIAEWLGYVPAEANGTTNYLSKFTGTTELTDSQLYDDGINIGINSSTFTNPWEKVFRINGKNSFEIIESSNYVDLFIDVQSPTNNDTTIYDTKNVYSNGIKYQWYSEYSSSGLYNIFYHPTGYLNKNGSNTYFMYTDTGYDNALNQKTIFQLNGVDKLSLLENGEVVIGPNAWYNVNNTYKSLIRATDAELYTTNLAGKDLYIQGGRGRGTGAGGKVIIATAPSGTSGNTLNPTVDRVTVLPNGNVGIGINPLYNLHVNGPVAGDSFIKAGGTGAQYLMADGSVTTGGGGGIAWLQSDATDLTVWNLGKGSIAGNTSFGYQAMKSNIDGGNNTVYGYNALLNNTTGGSNTVYGAYALSSATTGNENVSIGTGSLGAIATGALNTSIGWGAGSQLTDNSSGNVHIGYFAGPAYPIVESNKLYINNLGGIPLIGGDFVARTVEIDGKITSKGLLVNGQASTSYSSDSEVIGAKTLDFNSGNIAFLTLIGDATITLSNAIAGAVYTIRLTQGNLGSYTVIWDPVVKWGGGTTPTLSTAVGAIDIVTLLYDGTNFYGNIVKNFA